MNVASRMETTDVEGRIQVPQNVYERLNHAFVLEERGQVDIKGKGVMHTWYLVGRRDDEASEAPSNGRRRRQRRPPAGPAASRRHLVGSFLHDVVVAAG